MVYAIALTVVYIIAFIGFRVKVTGKENLDASEGSRYIICSNHLHICDPVFIALRRYGRQKLLIMGKAELFKHPITNWFFRKVGVVPVDRGRADMDVINKAQDELRGGRPMLIFPEGTRSKTGKMLPIKSGALVIAAATDATILPCHISYGGKFKIFGRVYINFGKPLTPDILALDMKDKATLRSAKKLLQSSIEELADVR